MQHRSPSFIQHSVLILRSTHLVSRMGASPQPMLSQPSCEQHECTTEFPFCISLSSLFLSDRAGSPTLADQQHGPEVSWAQTALRSSVQNGLGNTLPHTIFWQSLISSDPSAYAAAPCVACFYASWGHTSEEQRRQKHCSHTYSTTHTACSEEKATKWSCCCHSIQRPSLVPQPEFPYQTCVAKVVGEATTA